MMDGMVGMARQGFVCQTTVGPLGGGPATEEPQEQPYATASRDRSGGLREGSAERP